jgi:pimeloyl-ACP methyl ester carboxylesterase
MFVRSGDTYRREEIIMGTETATTSRPGQKIRADGIDIHYVEAGSGTPLVLLHGGIVSANPTWGPHPFAYASHIASLAVEFRVIAPDTRGAGGTVHDSGATSYARLAEDVVALIDALGLDRPILAGFSEGGITAAVVGIEHSDVVRAVVNHSGYDAFNPQAMSFAMMRQALGGSPTAAAADPQAAAAFFDQSDEMRMTFELMKADHDDGQGAGGWQRYMELAFDRLTTPPGYTFEDLGRISVPTLILTGDRDQFCSAEEGVTAYRALPLGELAILPDHGHVISAQAVAATMDFARRHI